MTGRELPVETRTVAIAQPSEARLICADGDWRRRRIRLRENDRRSADCREPGPGRRSSCSSTIATTATATAFRLAERAALNYDHPDSLETDLLVGHLHELRAGRPVELPLYDFADFARKTVRERAEPRRMIIVEGILIFTDAELRGLMDVKVFVDTDADTRFIRRLQRDIADRGRTVHSVIEQYLGTVKPMHLDFVEPSKRYADIIVPQGGHNVVAIDMLLTLISSQLGARRR